MERLWAKSRERVKTKSQASIWANSVSPTHQRETIRLNVKGKITHPLCKRKKIPVNECAVITVFLGRLAAQSVTVSGLDSFTESTILATRMEVGS